MKTAILALCLVALVGCHSTASIQWSTSPVGDIGSAAEEGAPEREGHDEEDFHRHHVAVFGGDTFIHGEHAGTIGVDYEYRINKLLGVGAFADKAFGEFDSTLIGAAVFLHPWKGLGLMAGVGGELEHGHTQAVGRVGIGYNFHLTENLSVGPWAYLDLVDGGETKGVVGLSFGYGFGK